MHLNLNNFEHLRQTFTQVKSEMAINEPDLFKDKLIYSYNRWVFDELDAIFAAPFSEEGTQEALRAFFDNHWSLVKGTSLSPTAIPNSDITLFLCKIAPLICGDKKPIEILCTDIQWDPIMDNYPVLDESIPLEQIIKTHIVSDDGKSLIPVSYLTEENFINNTFQRNLQGTIAYNPYDQDYKPISRNEFNRLIEHSQITAELNQSIEDFTQLNTEKNADLYSELDKLCKVIRLEDAHQGRGNQKKVGEGAFLAIAKFGEFYGQLSEEKIEKIPDDVREAIDELRKAAGDYPKPDPNDPNKKIDMEARIDTCAGTRREKIEAAMIGNEQTLLGITLDTQSVDQQKVKLLKERDQLRADLSGQLKPNEQRAIAYKDGSEKLSINQTLLNTLGIQFHIRSPEELDLIKNLNVDEIAVLLNNNQALQNEIMAQIQTFDIFVLLSHNFNVEKLNQFLTILAPKLEKKFINSKEDLSALLISHENPEMVKLIMRHFGHTHTPRFDVLNPIQVKAIREVQEEASFKEMVLFRAAKREDWAKVRELMEEEGVKVKIMPDGSSASSEILKRIQLDPYCLYTSEEPYLGWAIPFLAKKVDIYQKDKSGSYVFAEVLSHYFYGWASDKGKIAATVLERNTNPEQKQQFLNQLVKHMEYGKGPHLAPQVIKVMIEHGAPLNMKVNSLNALEWTLSQLSEGKETSAYTQLAHFMLKRNAPIERLHGSNILERLIKYEFDNHYKIPVLTDVALAKKFLEKGATFEVPFWDAFVSVNKFCKAYGAHPELASSLFEQGIKLSDLYILRRKEVEFIVPNAINGLESENCSQDTKNYLDSIQFYPLLEELMQKELSLGLKLSQQTFKDPVATKKADEISTLIKELLSARRDLVKAETFNNDAQNKFTTRCSNAFEAARPTLSKHQSTAGMIFKGIVSFVMFPVFIYQALSGNLTKTKSEKIIDSGKDKLARYKSAVSELRGEPSNNELEQGQEKSASKR